ncbi:putative wall-associated receptor kinase-like 16 [Cocos nucifera]|nr:putative wall-associated receptor kinase-like 16 [Cocos nucifera]
MVISQPTKTWSTPEGSPPPTTRLQQYRKATPHENLEAEETSERKELMACRQVAVLLLLLRLSSAFAAPPMARPGCTVECGGVRIPYPFGFGDNSCFLDDFEIICNDTFNPPKPFLGRGNLELPVDIDLVNGVRPWVDLGNMKSIRFSDSRNFVAIGCNTLGYLIDRDKKFLTGGASLCNNMSFVTNGTCSGIGCGETRIPKGLRTFTVELESYYNHT